MDGGDGWLQWPAGVTCPGGGGGAHDKTIINKIMLRFRPIAPKPADLSAVEHNKNMLLSSKKRVKRKYVRVCKSNRIRKSKTKESSSSSDQEKKSTEGEDGSGGGGDGLFNNVVTLQLLPDDRGDLMDCSSEKNGGPAWCNLDHGGRGNKQRDPGGLEGDKAATVESWATVECVTDMSTCMGDKGWLRCRDVEGVMRELEEDTCPAFISDGAGKVMWMNMAYKKTVMKEDDDQKVWSSSPSPEIRVWLVIKEKVVPYLHYSDAWSCWVRLQYTWRMEGKGKYGQMVLPCDVWRMEGGGFAWRLDLEAALSLGR